MFQQDGAPPYWSNKVRKILDRYFPGRWLGPDGAITWSPRSRDITPWIFFLFGIRQGLCLQIPVQDLVTLCRRIIEAVQTVDVEILQSIWRELEYRLNILRATGGTYFIKRNRIVLCHVVIEQS